MKLKQQVNYYPFGMAFADGVAQDVQPYKFTGKELDNKHKIGIYDSHARQQDTQIPRFLSIDPLAEKYYSWSPYAYVMNNPLRFIDPDGRDEYEVNKDGEWIKISDIGGSIGVDFYHTKAINDMGKTITHITDRQGNWIEMSDGKRILEGGETRSNNTDYKTIYDEFVEGTGPVTSVFEGDHPANKSIQEHYLYKKTASKFSSSGENKNLYTVDWDVFDVLKTGTGNKQAQMMGSYSASFYKLGDKTLNLLVDSKSNSSLYLHSSFAFNYDRGQQVYNPLAGGWQTAPNKKGNTNQVYLFYSK